MALTQRRIPTTPNKNGNAGSHNHHKNVNDNDNKNQNVGNQCGIWLLLLAIMVLSWIIFTTISESDTAISDPVHKLYLKGTSLLLSPSLPFPPGKVYTIDESQNIKVVVNYDETMTQDEGTGNNVITISVGGSHQVVLMLGDDPQSSCQDGPKLWLGLEGDALIGIVLYEDLDSKQWKGSFSSPLEGSFSLIAYWYGCDVADEHTRQKIVLQDSVIVKKNGGDIDSGKVYTSSMLSPPLFEKEEVFPLSLWMSSKKFDISADQEGERSYIWHNPLIPPGQAILLKPSDTALSQQGTVLEDDNHSNNDKPYYEFERLSNYELVCFFGSKSAEDLRASFLQLRPIVAPHQRPFKFHIYQSQNFQHPDKDWNEETRKRLRKCKHIIVSFDELDSILSQPEYTDQVTTFINHLLKVIPDDTFPIWMLSMIESSFDSIQGQQQCHSPYLPKSSFHPCNVALKSLFNESPFPDRVRLLDSTDISFPLQPQQSSAQQYRKDIFGVIALRLYIVIGKQVQTWRQTGQQGTVKGLERNGETEPNFELVPYTGWA